jgi:hypothetical protein
VVRFALLYRQRELDGLELEGLARQGRRRWGDRNGTGNPSRVLNKVYMPLVLHSRTPPPARSRNREDAFLLKSRSPNPWGMEQPEKCTALGGSESGWSCPRFKVCDAAGQAREPLQVTSGKYLNCFTGLFS